MRNTYIENNDPADAFDRYISLFGIRAEKETVDIDSALGRYTYKPVLAKICDPMYNAAAMDGIAVHSKDTFGANELNKIRLIQHENFEYINTGGQIKAQFDSVIMIEDCILIDENTIEIIEAAAPWQHIRVVGESIVAGEMILPSKHKIRPLDMGALVAGGYKEIEVYKKPKIGIIPTGAELVENPNDIGENKLMESNSHVFMALADQYGAEGKRYPIVRDNIDDLKKTILQAISENDIVVINAGTSAGTKDFTLKCIKELGTLHTHGVAIKPGKPTILAEIMQKPVIGVPGYPVSAYLMFDKFVKPIVMRFLDKQNDESADFIEASVTRSIVSSIKNEEIIRVSLGYVDNKFVATPLERGAAAVMSLIKADGKMIIPRNLEGIEAGKTVEIELLKPVHEIKKTLVVTGSHDLIIDVISDKMPLSSAHVGSMGGITAIKRGECHLAPIHLLDEESGEYNLSYARKFIKDKKMLLIKGVGRVQGFIVQKGNPFGIKNFADLKNNIKYANRQRGAGTRILFDYSLKKENIEISEIYGYEKEFNTHLAVAIAVKSGQSDVGLGIYAAAKAMDLDFVPLFNEEYDFLIAQEYLEDTRVQDFISIIKSDEFKTQLNEFSGYTYDRIGEIIEI